MLKIGEFSKLSHLTVKALRFYEKEGILLPASTDEWTGYRFYETSQLEAAARIRAYRQLELSIDEIKAIIAGTDARQILSEKAKTLAEEKNRIDKRLSIINHIMEDKDMKYHTEKGEAGSGLDREANPGEDHLFFRNCDEALFGHHAVDSVSRRRMPEAESGNQMR